MVYEAIRSASTCGSCLLVLAIVLQLNEMVYEWVDGCAEERDDNAVTSGCYLVNSNCCSCRRRERPINTNDSGTDL
jgi:protein-S-isoprenylcysteine O-methyltransferase Ste14